MKKLTKHTARCVRSVLILLIAVFAIGVLYNNIIPDSVSCISGEKLPSFAGAVGYASDSISVSKDENAPSSYTAQYRLFGIFPLKSVSVSVYDRSLLYVGGMPFGVRFSTDGIIVVGYSSDVSKLSNPAYNAGIRPSDVITKINGKTASGAQSLVTAAENGNEVKLSYVRGGKESTVSIKPYYSESEHKYKTGLLVRDSGGGIGTVTYIVPSTNEFGGLGHGICDGDTGALLPLTRGAVTDVTINSIVKGVCGTPGELHGSFGSQKTGSLIKNTACGVFGMFVEKPSNCGELLPIGLSSELKCGDAQVYCTLDGTGVHKYSIKITDINRDAKGSKCFSIKITDPELIAKTGGIVQGMSGSPIVQDGKIVGAVTHVMVNDPTAGYGIFIENMLTQSEG